MTLTGFQVNVTERLAGYLYRDKDSFPTNRFTPVGNDIPPFARIEKDVKMAFP